MNKLIMPILLVVLLIPVLEGCSSYSVPDDIAMSSPAPGFQPEVEILDAYCTYNPSSRDLTFEFRFTIKNLKNENIEATYYWTLNDPMADGPGHEQNTNVPLARIFQGKGSVSLLATEAKPIVISMKQDKEYDPRFYVMYINVYRDNSQVGYYRGQKSIYDWDYSVTPPVSTSKITPQINREQAIDTASQTLPQSIVGRAVISAELHGWYWEVIFDNLNAEADELMPWPLKPPPPPPEGQSADAPYPGIWQSVIITVDAQTGNIKSAGAYHAPEPGPYISREQAINNAKETMLQTPAEFNWGVEVIWFENAQVEAYLRGDTWIVLFWKDSSTDNHFSVTVNALTGLATGASRE